MVNSTSPIENLLRAAERAYDEALQEAIALQKRLAILKAAVDELAQSDRGVDKQTPGELLQKSLKEKFDDLHVKLGFSEAHRECQRQDNKKLKDRCHLLQGERDTAKLELQRSQKANRRHKNRINTLEKQIEGRDELITALRPLYSKLLEVAVDLPADAKSDPELHRILNEANRALVWASRELS